MNLSENRIKRRLTVFAVTSAAMLAVIFSQSLLNARTSGNVSGYVLRILKPLLDPYDRIDSDVFHYFIRKTAHFSEFAALGLCLGGFSVNLGLLRQRRYVALPMLLTLCAAVSDEFLQYFTGRGSMVTDVVLDYAGALTGLMLVWMFIQIRTLNSRRRERKKYE